MSATAQPIEHPSKKFYIDTGRETFEVTEATFNEMASKALENATQETEDGYFWTSRILRLSK